MNKEERIVYNKNYQLANKESPPIGAALLGLQGGILRAEQVLAQSNLSWIKEEREILFERIQECKLSLMGETFPSLPCKVLSKNAPTMLLAAEAILHMLSERLSSAKGHKLDWRPK